MGVDWGVDLAELITEELGPPVAREGAGTDVCWWLCPFHGDSNPSLKITPNGKHFYCHGCGERGDAVDFLQKLHNLTFREALRRLKGSSSPSRNGDSRRSRGSRGPRGPRKPAGPSLATLKPPPPPKWQEGARYLITTARHTLWHLAAGELGLSELRARGLRDQIIKKHRLGWCDPSEYEVALRRFVTKGITIPWQFGRTVRAVRFRSCTQSSYSFLKGSRIGVMYPTLSFLPGKPVLICEGELDALLAIQEVGDLVQVGTLGSASQRLTAETLASMACVPLVLLAYDADKAGDKAAAHWRRLLPRTSHRARPPDGMDLTDILTSGRSLRKWVQQKIREARR